jgi:hypothetical protein
MYDIHSTSHAIPMIEITFSFFILLKLPTQVTRHLSEARPPVGYLLIRSTYQYINVAFISNEIANRMFEPVNPNS